MPCCPEKLWRFAWTPSSSSLSRACWEDRRRENLAVFLKSGRRPSRTSSSSSSVPVPFRALLCARGEPSYLPMPLVSSIARWVVAVSCTVSGRRGSSSPNKLRRPFWSGAAIIWFVYVCSSQSVPSFFPICSESSNLCSAWR